MMTGMKKPNTDETSGGRTPEMNVNVPGEDSDQDSRKGTKVVSYEEGRVVSPYPSAGWD